eukprot:TRINITY_DN376_c2_g1_i1.p1 TRINITY_DN376_c2_g1~~TRINITY_DN376_c2_g1_i1.p1  ORF type:complete len:330 (-),score=40.90 TRINITY_DN376_c2_g1_i1:2816-3805(-)
MFSTISFVPTKPTKQPLFGPRYFVVGAGDFFKSTASSAGKVVSCGPKAPAKRQVTKTHIPKSLMVEEVTSPRGPQEATVFELSEYESSISSIDEESSVSFEEQSDFTPAEYPSTSELTSTDELYQELEGFQDPDLAVNYSEDLDFLAEKLLLQEEQHQNLAKQVQGLKETLKGIMRKCQPDFIEDAIKSLGKKNKVSKQIIQQIFALESELKAYETKMESLSRDVLAAQTHVGVAATEVSSFSSNVAFKSERINALGLLNYGSVAKRMVSEINDAQIYCDLLAIWAQDLNKFNHNLCYEISNIESSAAEHNNQLRRLKLALCSTQTFHK